MMASRSSVRSRILCFGLLALSGCTRVPLPDRFPDLPDVGELAGAGALADLDAVLHRGPMVTTSFDDARLGVASLDGYAPTDMAPLGVLGRDADGAFLLAPGSYAFMAASYCLHAGTHGPSSGDGYLQAPLAGPGATTIRRILRRSVDVDVPQRDVQLLIWAVLARTRLESSPRLLATARALLTPGEIARLDGGALGVLSRQALEELGDRVAPELRPVLRAESALRDGFARGRADYDALERIAVLAGAAPAMPGDRDIPSGRWSYDPAGFFVRYEPHGYNRTRIEVHVPDDYAVRRDAAGRISLVESSDGSRLAIRYADAGGMAPELAGAASPSRPGEAFVAPFVTMELTRRRLARPEYVGSETDGVGPGWTLVGDPGTTPMGTSLPGLDARRKAAREVIEEARQLRAEVGVGGKVPPSDFADLTHLRAAVAAAGESGGPAATFLAEAWQASLCHYLGGCGGADRALVPSKDTYGFGGFPGGGGAGPRVPEAANALFAASGRQQRQLPVYDPTATTATPARTGAQRLAQSSRPAKGESASCRAAKNDIEDARDKKSAFADTAKLNRAVANDWSSSEYTEALFGSCGDCESPMWTNPTTCTIVHNWDREEYHRRHLPDVSYDADQAHEEYHRSSCQRSGPMRYAADMSFPVKLAAEERAAYDAKIRWLQDWVAEHCR